MTENAAVAEEEPAEERAFDYARTVALSDGVFAIGLTLLVLNISVPVLAPAHHDLGAGLLDRHSEFSSYALSFVVIAFLWIRHHGFFRVLDRIDAKLTVLNRTYLAFVAFLPYPTRVLGLCGDQTSPVVLYAATGTIVASIAPSCRSMRSASTCSPSWQRARNRRIARMNSRPGGGPACLTQCGARVRMGSLTVM